MAASCRDLIRQCLDAALAAVDGRRAVAAALQGVQLPRGCPVLAVGKAAPAMLAGAADSLEEGLGPALCIARADSARPGEPGLAHARLLHGDHPVPGARSLAAGAELLAFLEALPRHLPLLCLWSGGSSALVEVLPPNIDAEELARVNRWLMASGLPIEQVNQVRARLSCLKAGGLARRLAGRRILVLAISDVPGDDPAVIGSGPWTVPPAETHADPATGLPHWLTTLLERAATVRDARPQAYAEVDYRVVASGGRAQAAAGRVAHAAGLSPVLHEAPLQGTVEAAADGILAAIFGRTPALHAWSGETTLRLPQNPGNGGRNSHLALTLACALAGRNNISVLCAATDGSDGTGAAAGGWADGGVIARGTACGLDARQALADADSGSFLAATGDALVLGATGTNVMDLVLAVTREQPCAS
jgi:glycerate 2-kinase